MAGDFTPTPRREMPGDILPRPGMYPMVGLPLVMPPRVGVPEEEWPWNRRSRPKPGEVVAFSPRISATSPEEFVGMYFTPWPWWYR